MTTATLNSMTTITSRIVREKIVKYLAAKETEKIATAEIKAVKPDLLDAMAGAPTAICGPYSLDLSTRKGSAASIELSNGRVIGAEDLREIVLRDGTTIKAADIAKITGARAESEVFTVKAR